ncbi:DNA methyltransferase [Chryseobacterium sp.]
MLDPFSGSFTTCKVALELHRKCIGIDINPMYCTAGKARCLKNRVE